MGSARELMRKVATESLREVLKEEVTKDKEIAEELAGEEE